MADLPQITNPEPIIEPATPERTYDSKYIVGMGYLDNGETAKLNIEFRPYDYQNGIVHHRGPKSTLTIPDVWQTADQIPYFAQAMGQVVQCAALIDHKNTLENQLTTEQTKEEPNQDTLNNLTTQLTTIYEELGIEILDGTE